MSKMTRIDGVPDIDDINPGMAYLPGTGPDGKTCGDCQYRGYYRESKHEKWSVALQMNIRRRYKTGSCEMFRKLSGRHGDTVKKIWPACKYFEQKNNGKNV